MGAARYLSLLLVTGLLVPQSSAAEPTPEIIRVEEDWVAYISNPDAGLTAPQIANVISPTTSTDGPFGIIELNHRSQPSFRGGGYQVQSWLGDQRADYVFSDETAKLSNAYDKLAYTVALEVTGSQLNFILKNGRSRTWGRFARNGLMASASVSGASLAEYDPQFSVDNTSINVGAHRVELMYQIRTRYYSADGLERTDETPRVLHRFRNVIQYVSLEEYEQNTDYYNIEITESE